jgi:hypothetical protein
MAHDRVAKKDFSRKSPEPIEEEPQSSELTVKIEKKRGQPLVGFKNIDTRWINKLKVGTLGVKVIYAMW